MRSIKPGRGPSLFGGLMGIFVAIGGIIWTLAAFGSGAPGFMGLFGILFVIMALSGSIYNLVNATRKNRYSHFDIVDHHVEPDPLNERFYGQGRYPNHIPADSKYCPYCGSMVQKNHKFCHRCGKELPELK